MLLEVRIGSELHRQMFQGMTEEGNRVLYEPLADNRVDLVNKLGIYKAIIELDEEVGKTNRCWGFHSRSELSEESIEIGVSKDGIGEATHAAIEGLNEPLFILLEGLILQEDVKRGLVRLFSLLNRSSMNGLHGCEIHLVKETTELFAEIENVLDDAVIFAERLNLGQDEALELVIETNGLDGL